MKRQEPKDKIYCACGLKKRQRAQSSFILFNIIETTQKNKMSIDKVLPKVITYNKITQINQKEVLNSGRKTENQKR